MFNGLKVLIVSQIVTTIGVFAFKVLEPRQWMWKVVWDWRKKLAFKDKNITLYMNAQKSFKTEERVFPVFFFITICRLVDFLRQRRCFFCALPRKKIFPAQGDSFSCPGSRFFVISDFSFQFCYEHRFPTLGYRIQKYSFYLPTILP